MTQIHRIHLELSRKTVVLLKERKAYSIKKRLRLVIQTYEKDNQYKNNKLSLNKNLHHKQKLL